MESKKKKKLTIAQLKSFKGYENVSEDEAEDTIATLEKLSSIFFELYLKKKKESEMQNNSGTIIEVNNVLNTDNYESKRNAA